MVAALQKIVNLISPDWYLRPADSGFFILNAMKKLIFIFALVFVSCEKQTETFCTDARYTEHGFLFQYNDHYNGFVYHESDIQAGPNGVRFATVSQVTGPNSVNPLRIFANTNQSLTGGGKTAYALYWVRPN